LVVFDKKPELPN